jgi:hypothetical protein
MRGKTPALPSIDLAPLQQSRRLKIASLIGVDGVSRFTNCVPVFSDTHAIRVPQFDIAYHCLASLGTLSHKGRQKRHAASLNVTPQSRKLSPATG